jgi:hypothetical protein
MYRGRMAAVPLLSVILSLVFFSAAYAQTAPASGSTSGGAANEQCPSPKADQVYNSGKPPNKSFYDPALRKNIFNLYGKTCEDKAKSGGEMKAMGICTAAHTCKATDYVGLDGKKHPISEIDKKIDQSVKQPETPKSGEEVTKQIQDANKQDQINCAFEGTCKVEPVEHVSPADVKDTSAYNFNKYLNEYGGGTNPVSADAYPFSSPESFSGSILDQAVSGFEYQAPDFGDLSEYGVQTSYNEAGLPSYDTGGDFTPQQSSGFEYKQPDFGNLDQYGVKTSYDTSGNPVYDTNSFPTQGTAPVPFTDSPWATPQVPQGLTPEAPPAIPLPGLDGSSPLPSAFAPQPEPAFTNPMSTTDTNWTGANPGLDNPYLNLTGQEIAANGVGKNSIDELNSLFATPQGTGKTETALDIATARVSPEFQSSDVAVPPLKVAFAAPALYNLASSDKAVDWTGEAPTNLAHAVNIAQMGDWVYGENAAVTADKIAEREENLAAQVVATDAPAPMWHAPESVDPGAVPANPNTFATNNTGDTKTDAQVPWSEVEKVEELDAIGKAQKAMGFEPTTKEATGGGAEQIGQTRFDVTGYAPCQSASACPMQGGPESSVPGPDGKALVRTLDDYRLGKSEYVTGASDSSRYGEKYVVPEITYKSAIDGKEYTLKEVPIAVHDTGSAFQGRPDKLDIATGMSGSDAQAMRFASNQPFLSERYQTYAQYSDIPASGAAPASPSLPVNGAPDVLAPLSGGATDGRSVLSGDIVQSPQYQSGAESLSGPTADSVRDVNFAGLSTLRAVETGSLPDITPKYDELIPKAEWDPSAYTAERGQEITDQVQRVAVQEAQDAQLADRYAQADAENAAYQQQQDAKLAEVIRADQAAYDEADRQAAVDEAARQQILSDQRLALEARKADAPAELTQEIVPGVESPVQRLGQALVTLDGEGIKSAWSDMFNPAPSTAAPDTTSRFTTVDEASQSIAAIQDTTVPATPAATLGFASYGAEGGLSGGFTKDFGGPAIVSGEEFSRFVADESVASGRGIGSDYASSGGVGVDAPLGPLTDRVGGIGSDFVSSGGSQGDVPLPTERPDIVVSDIPLPTSRPLDIPLAESSGGRVPDILAANAESDNRLQTIGEDVPLPPSRPFGIPVADASGESALSPEVRSLTSSVIRGDSGETDWNYPASNPLTKDLPIASPDWANLSGGTEKSLVSGTIAANPGETDWNYPTSNSGTVAEPVAASDVPLPTPRPDIAVNDVPLPTERPDIVVSDVPLPTPRPDIAVDDVPLPPSRPEIASAPLDRIVNPDAKPWNSIAENSGNPYDSGGQQVVTLKCAGGGGACGPDSTSAAVGGTPLTGNERGIAVPADSGIKIGDKVDVQVGGKVIENVPVTDYTQTGSKNYVASGALEKELGGTGKDTAIITPVRELTPAQIESRIPVPAWTPEIFSEQSGKDITAQIKDATPATTDLKQLAIEGYNQAPPDQIGETVPQQEGMTPAEIAAAMREIKQSTGADAQSKSAESDCGVWCKTREAVGNTWDKYFTDPATEKPAWMKEPGNRVELKDVPGITVEASAVGKFDAPPVLLPYDGLGVAKATGEKANNQVPVTKETQEHTILDPSNRSGVSSGIQLPPGLTGGLNIDASGVKKLDLGLTPLTKGTVQVAGLETKDEKNINEGIANGSQFPRELPSNLNVAKKITEAPSPAPAVSVQTPVIAQQSAPAPAPVSAQPQIPPASPTLASAELRQVNNGPSPAPAAQIQPQTQQYQALPTAPSVQNQVVPVTQPVTIVDTIKTRLTTAQNWVAARLSPTVVPTAQVAPVSTNIPNTNPVVNAVVAPTQNNLPVTPATQAPAPVAPQSNESILKKIENLFAASKPAPLPSPAPTLKEEPVTGFAANTTIMPADLGLSQTTFATGTTQTFPIVPAVEPVVKTITISTYQLSRSSTVRVTATMPKDPVEINLALNSAHVTADATGLSLLEEVYKTNENVVRVLVSKDTAARLADMMPGSAILVDAYPRLKQPLGTAAQVAQVDSIQNIFSQGISWETKSPFVRHQLAPLPTWTNGQISQLSPFNMK